MIIRGPLTLDHFTAVPNAWLRDPSLSYKAKGLIAAIVSHRPGYQLSTAQLIREGTDGKDSVHAGLRELEAAGYLHRRQDRGPAGRLAETVYEVVDRTLDPPPLADNPPEPGFPYAADPSTEDPPHRRLENREDQESFGARDVGLSLLPGGGDEQPAPRKQRSTRAPVELELTDDLRAWAILKAPAVADLDRETECFLDWHRAKGSLYADWRAAWRTWMRRSQVDAERRGWTPPAPPPVRHEAPPPELFDEGREADLTAWHERTYGARS
jgi:hypothetical protein